MRHGKTALCLLLAALTAAVLSGCAGGGEAGPDLDPAEMVRAMAAADTTLPDMVTRSSEDEAAKDSFTYLSDLDYGKVDAYCYACADAGTAEEMAVIRLKDRSDAAAMMDSLRRHLEARRGSFQQYDPDQVPLVDDAVITREGRYVALIVSRKNGLAQEAFRGFFPNDQ